jgi:hypothetical protein
MEHMHPLAGGAVNAFIKVSDHANISGVTVKPNPPLSDFRDDGFGVIRVRAIIDHLDLHFARTWILAKHAQKRFAKIIRAIVDRYHDRPKWAVYACRHVFDARWDHARLPID